MPTRFHAMANAWRSRAATKSRMRSCWPISDDKLPYGKREAALTRASPRCYRSPQSISGGKCMGLRSSTASRYFAVIAIMLLFSGAALAQHNHSAPAKKPVKNASQSKKTAKPAAKPADTTVCSDSGFGDNVRHAVKTSNPEAQKMFNQGLALDYGFNHNEAEKCFKRAAQLDPKMAMAYWGIALVVGPNYNLPVDAEREKQAYEAIQKAIQLAEDGPQVEKDYIDALSRRYTNQPTEDYHSLDVAYNHAMRELAKAYPDDLDAATLFAESGMNLRPWKLWNRDGTPAEG